MTVQFSHLAGFAMNQQYRVAVDTNLYPNLWSGNTAGFTFGAGLHNNSNGNNAVRILGHDWQGNIELFFGCSGFGAANQNSLWMGFYPTANDASFNASDGLGGLLNNASFDTISIRVRSNASSTTSNHALFSGNTSDKAATTHTTSPTADRFIIRRLGSAWTFWLNDVLDTTFSGTPSGPMRLIVTHPAGSDPFGGAHFRGSNPVLTWVN